MAIPKYDDLYNPLLQAIQKLGGSASVAEQEAEVAGVLHLSEKEAAEIHKGNRTKLSYRLAWARNYLKHFGVLDNSARGVWALTKKGTSTEKVDKKEVNRFVSALQRGKGTGTEKRERWQDGLLGVIAEIPPSSFEKLCQRVLRESGFVQVEVTGKSGDGGIDGRGVVKIQGLLSFHVIFQCKRYKGTVSASQVRDFRGAMVGRADKGLIITTGSFSKDARLEAQRDGAPPLDLVDGEELAEKLKDLSLGVKTQQVEEVLIDEEWFKGI